MRPIVRSLFPALILALSSFSSVTAWAQMDCYQCVPESSCDQECTYCTGWYQLDGSCGDGLEYSTCGDAGDGCMPYGCTPSYVETARQNRGTYGNGSMFSCSHHSVDWVTRVDSNHCNTNSYYWTISACEDSLDLPGKSGWYPDCCDGYAPGGAYDPRYSCNGQHSC